MPRNAPRPTLAGALLFASSVSGFCFAGGFLLLPWALGRLVDAIRAPHLLRTQASPRTFLAGLALLAITAPPTAAALFGGFFRLWPTTEPVDSRALGPLVAGLALMPLFLHLPLVLTHDAVGGRPIPLAETLRRSIVHASASPLRTLCAAVALAAPIALVIVACSSLRATLGDLPGVCATLALLPVAVAAPLGWLSRYTPEHPPPPRRWMLLTLTALSAPPLLFVILAGLLATAEPRGATVVLEGRGIQLERGLLTERGPRGAFEDPRYTIVGQPGGVEILRGDGEAARIEARYSGLDAWMTREACSDWHAWLHDDCHVLRMRGTDWEVQLLLDSEGARLDDGWLDRAFERVGVLGSLAALVTPAVLLALLLAILRIHHNTRRLSARGRRHRLAGQLELGEGGALEADAIIGGRNRILLTESGRALRLPSKQNVLAVEARLRSAAPGERALPVLLACDTLPAAAAHRDVDTPMPASAEILVGDPEAIEGEFLVGTGQGLGILVLVAMLLAAASGVAIALG
jgi:hypothetical protein